MVKILNKTIVAFFCFLGIAEAFVSPGTTTVGLQQEAVLHATSNQHEEDHDAVARRSFLWKSMGLLTLFPSVAQAAETKVSICF